MRRDRGVALISALLIVALATTLAVMVSLRANLRLRDAGNAQALAQAVASARGALDFGRWALYQDQLQDSKSGSAIDWQGEAWAQALPAFPVEGGSVSGVVHDMGGLINLNNLGLQATHTAMDLLVMQTLLSNAGIDPSLANALADWVDGDITVSLPGGAEDTDYLGMTPARLAANQPLRDVDELQRVRGFTPAMVAALRPYVTALPVHTPVNVNTAPAAVIAALFQVSAGDAEAFIKVRTVAPISDNSDLLKRAPPAIRNRLTTSAQGTAVAGTIGPAGGLTGSSSSLASLVATAASGVVPQFSTDWSVSSSFFQIDARATYGQVQYGLSTLVRREQKSVYPTILWERRTLF